MRSHPLSSFQTLGAAASLLACSLLVPRSAFAVQPTGYLDNAGCDAIAGWAQDPDVPNQPIDVHVYYGVPAGTPGAPAIAVRANVHRDDLCAAIGSCEHGFFAPSPLAFHDGNARDVYAYGIDTGGEGNPVLGNSPRTLQCPPAAQSGVRRKVVGAPTYDAWRFSSFWDLLPLPAADADLLPDGPDIPDKPELVQADDGTGQTWLVDGGVRRLVSPGAAATWRFDLGKASVRPAAEVYALVEGTPLRPRPVLFLRGALYLVDDPQPVVPGGTSSSSSGAGGAGGGWGEGGEGGEGGEMTPAKPPSGACTLGAPGNADERSFFLPILGIAAVAARLRRRK
ncbi:hypothetical protein [Polyangium sp. y55x31]|uniref:hypothetical protein n=1 Tax=Polyangium sp. y55x31 TaxID=3042688 RepID=UPI002482EC13|nr:hypothetical protein [Polyangium sp. y55x31]MDI1477343.1 hypothetical protein [Polyangium sp. y55x31]